MFFRVLLVLYTASAFCSFAVELRQQNFASDPGWEGFNNHVIPAKLNVVTQDFGLVSTALQKTWPAAIGGRIARAAKPAFFAKALSPASLNQPLKASGEFKLTKSTGNSGVFFGWFNSRQPGGSGRPINSFGLDFDGENSGGRLAVRMINSKNKSCGTFITPFIPGKFRPTPIRNDGTLYHWQLDYTPGTGPVKGRFTFTIHSDAAEHEAFDNKTFSVELPEGFQEENASFDHFGIMNMMKGGGFMNLYFGNLALDGTSILTAGHSDWEGTGNRETYADSDAVGAHDFGWSKTTSYAGGQPGEIGGKFWRTGKFAYYADRVGHLNINRPLEASGRIVLLVGSPDSDMLFGWFNSSSTNGPPPAERDFLGVHVGGPTRIGHYFSPRCVTRKGESARLKTAPILEPGRSFAWKLNYDPAGQSGLGTITARLGDQSVTLNLRKGQEEQGASFDRFGLFTVTQGGQMVKVFFDDLKYTAGQ